MEHYSFYLEKAGALVALIALPMSIYGCGRAYPLEDSSVEAETGHSPHGVPSSERSAPVAPGRALGLELYSSGGPSPRLVSDLPSLAQNLISEFFPVYSRNRVSFVRPMLLPTSERYYLAWPDRIYDKAITNVLVDHSTLTPQNERIHHSSSQSPLFDEHQHRWILSLSELFSLDPSRERHLNEVNTQAVTLNLGLSDSTRISIEVRLRVRGISSN